MLGQCYRLRQRRRRNWPTWRSSRSWLFDRTLGPTRSIDSFVRRLSPIGIGRSRAAASKGKSNHRLQCNRSDQKSPLSAIRRLGGHSQQAKGILAVLRVAGAVGTSKCRRSQYRRRSGAEGSRRSETPFMIICIAIATVTDTAANAARLSRKLDVTLSARSSTFGRT
jgi:hypothetical protein